MSKSELRVGFGLSAFNNFNKINYSEETKCLIGDLVKEAKLTTMQRKSMEEAMNRGDALPSLMPASALTKEKQIDGTQVKYDSHWKKRPLTSIINAGSYERERYISTKPALNKEKQKRFLASMMAYGKVVPETARKPKIIRDNLKVSHDESDKELLQEWIRERMQFLADMESLGLKKKYMPIIYQEIAQKLHQIEVLDKKSYLSVYQEFEKSSFKRPLPIEEIDQ